MNNTVQNKYDNISVFFSYECLLQDVWFDIICLVATIQFSDGGVVHVDKREAVCLSVFLIEISLHQIKFYSSL